MATCSAEDGRKPSERLTDFLNGVTPIKDADPVTLSWAEFVIHKKAAQMVATGDPQHIKKEIGNAPEQIRPYLQKEARRQWANR